MKKKVSITSRRLFFFLTIFFSSALLATVAQAQTDTGSSEENTEAAPAKVKYKSKKNVFRFNNVISIYPFQAAINYMTLGYELRTGERTTFKTIAGFAQKEKSLLDINNISKYSGFKIEMQLKYFINKKNEVLNGVYFAPFVLYKGCNFSFDEDNYVYDPVLGYSTYVLSHKKDKASAFHVGFLLGYHSKIGDNFTLDMFAGEGLMSSTGNLDYGSRVFDVYANEIRMKVGLNIGFGF